MEAALCKQTSALFQLFFKIISSLLAVFHHFRLQLVKRRKFLLRADKAAQQQPHVLSIQRSAFVVKQIRLDGRRTAGRCGMCADVDGSNMPLFIHLGTRRIDAFGRQRFSLRIKQVCRREIQLAPQLFSTLNHAADRIRSAEQLGSQLHIALCHGRTNSR